MPDENVLSLKLYSFDTFVLVVSPFKKDYVILNIFTFGIG